VSHRLGEPAVRVRLGRMSVDWDFDARGGYSRAPTESADYALRSVSGGTADRQREHLQPSTLGRE
jgi:hypothetical protein